MIEKYSSAKLSIVEVDTVKELEMIYDYIAKSPEHSSFINGVPEKQDFLDFFLGNAQNILYIVRYEDVYVGYGYIEYETDTTGRCHWGLAEYTPHFFVIVRDVLKYICRTTKLINIFAPIHHSNSVARKIAVRLGYRKVFRMHKYYDGNDFDMYLYYNKLNLK